VRSGASRRRSRAASHLGVKIVIGPLVLGAEHENIAVVETDSIEKVVEFSEMSSLAQWNSVRISPARTMAEALQEVQSMPPPVYN